MGTPSSHRHGHAPTPRGMSATRVHSHSHLSGPMKLGSSPQTAIDLTGDCEDDITPSKKRKAEGPIPSTALISKRPTHQGPSFVEAFLVAQRALAASRALEASRASLPSRRISSRSSRRAASIERIAASHHASSSSRVSSSQGGPKSSNTEEKRLRRFRPQPPQAFYEIYERAISQRFFVLGRQKTGTPECPGETVELTGSTGNLYTVKIGRALECDCPHAKKGNQCKHVIFVLKKVLNAPWNLSYQLALLSSELREIFAAAPPIESSHENNDKRKPVEGDCPICFSEFGSDPKAIVWCRAACGQNIHKECMEMWSRTKSSGGNVTCPMCRSTWDGDQAMVKKIEKSRGTQHEGYLNLAGQLGISQRRDHSTYSPWMEVHMLREAQLGGMFTGYNPRGRYRRG